MSSESLVYSNRKVCAGWDGQSRRFRLFAIVDSTTRKACKGGAFPWIFPDFTLFVDFLAEGFIQNKDPNK